MIAKKEHIKVLTILSLAASDTREDTIKSIIITSLYEIGSVQRDTLCNVIQQLYEFEPYKDEFLAIFDGLVDAGKVIKSSEEYILSEDQRVDFKDSEVTLRDQESARFQNFKNFISDRLLLELDAHKLKVIWSAFVEYLYNSFFEFGEEALKMFHPALNNGGSSHNHEDFVQQAFVKLKHDKELCEIFRITVDKFPDYASQQDLDFLNELALKTQSFASLGYNPEESSSDFDGAIIDWTLYLDTNVLYSILNLHSHPENQACKALIELINLNPQYLPIILRYSELTKVELYAKRDDFGNLDTKLSDSAVNAMLRTNDLDPFSHQFYQNLLGNRQATLHPSKVIELAANVLLKDKIDVSRNQKRVEQIGEDYLNVRIQEYRRFLDQKNDNRKEFNAKNGTKFRMTNKSDKQIIHDITLREVIINMRGAKTNRGSAVTLNSVKYYAITLDEILMEYDKYDIHSGSGEKGFPVFFRPSFLLNKLVKVLPIKTNDYKKAFLKAITSKGFNRDVQKSQDIQTIVNYLKEQGIDNEEIVYNLISEELFLEKYKKEQFKSGFNHAEFIESQLNKEISRRDSELKETKEALTLQSAATIQKEELTRELEFKSQSLEQERLLYKNAASKLADDLKKAQKTKRREEGTLSINFEAEQKNKEIEDLHQKNKMLNDELINQYKERKFKSWQLKVWWNLIWVIPLTLGLFTMIIKPTIFFNSDVDAATLRVTYLAILSVIDSLFFFLCKSRYLDESNMEKRRNRIPIPANLILK